MQVVYNSGHRARSSTPLHVVIYSLIPEDRAYQPIGRSGFLKAKNQARRWTELLRWRFLGRWRAHYSTFKDRNNTNRGDIAIRMAVRQQIERAFARQPITVTELAWGELDMVLKMSPPPDLVVIGGGGFLFADRDGRLPPRFARDVAALEAVSCPVAACAIGLNWLIESGTEKTFRFHRESLECIRRFLSRLTLGSVRDANSQRALAAVARRHLPVIVDSAFLLAAPAPPRSAEKMNRPIQIGLNLAFHGPHTSMTSHRMLPLMVNVCRRLEHDVSCRFTYFVHSDGEVGLAAALKLSGVQLDVVNDDVAPMLDAYRKMDIHVGQMLHSAILAMSVGTPALSLAYDMKSAGLYDLLGLKELCLDASTATEEEIVFSIKALIKSRDAVSAALISRRADLEAESHAFFAAVAALAPSYRSGRLAPLHSGETSAQEDIRTFKRK
ncbi:MAG: polysaccharide pyruvyl transferase family protein [Rhodospirillaceae bacterium]